MVGRSKTDKKNEKDAKIIFMSATTAVNAGIVPMSHINRTLIHETNFLWYYKEKERSPIAIYLVHQQQTYMCILLQTSMGTKLFCTSICSHVCILCQNLCCITYLGYWRISFVKFRRTACKYVKICWNHKHPVSS